MAVGAMDIHWTKAVRLDRVLILLAANRGRRKERLRRRRRRRRRLWVIIIRGLGRLVLLRHVDVHVFMLSLFLR